MKVNMGSMFHLADHHDAVTGEHSTYVRSAHSSGGNRAFRACVRAKASGSGGNAAQRREKFSAAAKSCKGVR